MADDKRRRGRHSFKFVTQVDNQDIFQFKIPPGYGHSVENIGNGIIIWLKGPTLSPENEKKEGKEGL